MTRPTTRAGRDAYDAANRKRRANELAARKAAEIQGHTYTPGRDEEPPVSATLYDLLGGTWRKPGKRAGEGWRLDGSEFSLKWSSPAMRALGPFIGPPRRDPEVLAGMKRRAALHRWHPERARAQDGNTRGPLPA